MGFLLTSLLLSALPATAAPQQDPILLEIGDHRYGLEEMLRFYEVRHRGHLSLLTSVTEVRGLVQRFRDFQLLVLDAEAQGIPESEEVQTQMAAYEQRLLRYFFLEHETSKQVAVTQEEIDAFHQRLQVIYRLHEIGTQTRKAADEAMRRLQAGEDFESVAADLSTLPSAKRGGVATPRRYDELPPEPREWVVQAAPGEVSGPLVAPQGWLLLRLDAVEEREPPPWAVAETRMMTWLMQDHSRELRDHLEERLREKYGLRTVTEVDPEWLAEDSEQPADTVLVEAEGVAPVTLGELRESLAIPPEAARDPDLVREAAEFAARRLMDERLLDEEAARGDWPRPPEIGQRVQEFREDLTVKILKRDVIFPGIEVSEERAREIFAAEKEKWAVPAEAEIEHILVPTREEALEISAALAAGMDFAELARERSIDAVTAEKGGYVGWVTPGKILPELDAVIFEVPLGQVSAPIQTQAGWHLIRVLRRHAGRDRTFEEVADKLIDREIRRLRSEALERWRGLLRERVPWQIREENLERAVAIIQARLKEEELAQQLEMGQ